MNSPDSPQPNRLHLPVAQLRAYLNDVLLETHGSDAWTAVAMMRLNRSDRIEALVGSHDSAERSVRWVKRLVRSLREHDRFSLVGSDELWLVMPQMRTPKVARRELQRIAGAVVGLAEEDHISVSISTGVAMGQDASMSAMQWLAIAESAMLEATWSNERFVERMVQVNGQEPVIDWYQTLRMALQEERTSVAYQPQIALAGNRCVGAEALLRLIGTEGQDVSPGLAIMRAEQTDLILPITAFVLNRAMQNLPRLMQDDETFTLSVNISARMFADESLPSLLDSMLRRWQIPPQAIMLEITESATVKDFDRSLLMMQRLKDLGLSLSIDDFGTGSSSLAYLRRFPLDELKIDQMFVRAMDDSEQDKQIVRSVIDLAHNFELKVVAEGVENQTTMQLLKGMDCDAAQGFHISPAVDEETFDQWRFTYCDVI